MIYFNKRTAHKIKINWGDFILSFSRTMPLGFKLTCVCRGRAGEAFNTTEEVLGYLLTKDSYELLMEIENKGFNDLVRLYHKASPLLQRMENTKASHRKAQRKVNELLSQLKYGENELNAIITKDRYHDWNVYLKNNSELTKWKNAEVTQRRNGELLGSFYYSWTVDDGYVDAYLRAPVSKDTYWYLKLVFPKDEDGDRHRMSIQSKNFLGICAYGGVSNYDFIGVFDIISQHLGVTDLDYFKNTLLDEGYIGGFDGYKSAQEAYIKIASQSGDAGKSNRDKQWWGHADAVETKLQEIRSHREKFLKKNRLAPKTIRQIGEESDALAKKNKQTISLDDYSSKALQTLSKRIFDEALAVLKGGDKEARGWYTYK